MQEQEDAACIDECGALIFGFEGEEEQDLGQYPIPKGTYANLLKKMGEGLNFKLKERVIQVNYAKENEKCKVRTDLNTYESDYVICALPLSIIKKEIVRINPPLPETFKNVMDKIRFGNFDKILVSFEKPFWKKDMGDLSFACN